MKHSTLVVGILLTLVAFGCGGPGTLSVEGTATFSVDGTPTGFVFDRPVQLEVPSDVPGDGTLAGYCTMSPEGFQLGINRSRIGTDEGVQVRFFDVERNADGYFISAQLGDAMYTATDADCMESSVDFGTDFVVVSLECMLSNADGAQAGLSADLTFEHCLPE